MRYICSLVLPLALLFIPGHQVIAQEAYVVEVPRAEQFRLQRIIPYAVVATGASFFLDRTASTLAHDVRSPFLSDFIHATDVAGDKAIIIPVLLAAYGSGRFIARDEKFTSTAVKSMQAVIVSAITTESIKILAGRARPFNDEGPWSFHPLSIGRDHHKSLPSGHASLSFAIFTPFAERYSRWIYLLPATVALGRVYQDKHWISDVTMGSFIGLISGLLFTHNENITLIPNGIRLTF